MLALAMAFTESEQSRIKHFLSYPDWVALAASIQLGFPAGSQPLFLVEDAFKRLTVGGEASVRRDLCELESIEHQISGARSRFKATKIDGLTINHGETKLLRQELTYWTLRLASDLGVVSNPYAAFDYQNGAGDGRNARVLG
jgi:hypothetical protein